MTVVEAIETTEAGAARMYSSQRELAFVLPTTRQLRFGWQQDGSSPGAFLAHRVARAPNDLRAHVQRIYFHAEGLDEPQSYGALVDLFIALGVRGVALRQRMLDAAKRLLDRTQYQALMRSLDAGLRASDAIPPAPASMLTKGMRSNRLLVERLSAQSAAALDPLMEARDYLEYGQLEEARQVLEQAILQDTRRLELHQDLLDIYRATMDSDALYGMWQRLSAEDNPAVDDWTQTASRLGVSLEPGD